LNKIPDEDMDNFGDAVRWSST